LSAASSGAVADEDRRHPLTQLGFEQASARGGVREQDQVGMAVHVEEARSDDEAAGVDLARRAQAVEITDGDDAAVAHRDVGRERGTPGAVDHRSAP
jgi:hypothetical protein